MFEFFICKLKVLALEMIQYGDTCVLNTANQREIVITVKGSTGHDAFMILGAVTSKHLVKKKNHDTESARI